MPVNSENNFEREDDADVDLNDASINETAAATTGGGSEEIEKLRAERDSLFERLARAQADFQNSRKRLAAEAEQNLQYANANLIKSLLPIIDNFERALAVDIETADTRTLMKGLQLVSEQLNKALKGQNVETISPTVGDAFDPTQHEALLQQPSDDVEPGHITQLLQRGYKLRDRTLRPAQVAVAKMQ